MTDPDLQRLIASENAVDPLTAPSPSTLDYLTSLHLSENELEILLGEAPGLSWVDVRKDSRAFFFRLRRRVARLVCNDRKLKESVAQSITVGAEAAWLALVGALGIAPSTVGAAALKPIAVGLIKSGVGTLCK